MKKRTWTFRPKNVFSKRKQITFKPGVQDRMKEDLKEKR